MTISIGFSHSNNIDHAQTSLINSGQEKCDHGHFSMRFGISC